MNDDLPHEYEVGTAGTMQKKYGWYAENLSRVTLDPNKVPEALQHLIPLAEKYGVSCDITRHDLGSKTSEKEKQALSEALRGYHGHIAKWLNTFPPVSMSNLPSEEETAFSRLCVFEAEECGGPGLPGKSTDIDKWYDEYLIRRYGTAE